MSDVLRKLPSDFCIHRYGVECRLVEEQDAEFIVGLRNDAKLGRYLHTTGSVSNQIDWIRQYKKREAEGIEYYFIFSKNGVPFGLWRMYNIDWIHLTYTGGSWVCTPGTSTDVSFTTVLIVDDIRETLGLLINIYEVQKGNTVVIKYHRNILCAVEYGETSKAVLFMSTPESRKKNRLRKLLGIEQVDVKIPVIECNKN